MLNEQDELHILCERLVGNIQDARWVTTEAVLTELLNHLGSQGTNLRHVAASFVEGLRSSPNVTIIPQTSTQFWRALLLYSQRLDKEWSLTGYVSFLVMKQERLKEALAYDRHFEQAGFTALLRNQPK